MVQVERMRTYFASRNQLPLVRIVLPETRCSALLDQGAVLPPIYPRLACAEQKWNQIVMSETMVKAARSGILPAHKDVTLNRAKVTVRV